MQIHLFDIDERAVINQNALNGLPDLVGSLVTIQEQLLHGTYDYIVNCKGRPIARVKENELNKISKDDMLLTVKVGNSIEKFDGEKAKIKLVDYLYRKIEIEFPDGSFEVIDVDRYLSCKYLKIALAGLMRSGKDTVAEYLINRYNFKRYAFGDELKRYYHELFGDSESKPREGYQWFGQVMRQHKPDIWVRKCFDNIEKENNKYIVISDLRQPNEYEKCQLEGFILVKVECDDELRLKRILEKNDKFDMKNLQHETESHIDNFEYDYIIKNDGSLDELYKQVDEIINTLK